MGTRVESDCQALPAVGLPQVTLPPHLRNGGHGSTSLTEQSEETGSQAYGTHSISNVVITTSSSSSPTLTSRNPVIPVSRAHSGSCEVWGSWLCSGSLPHWRREEPLHPHTAPHPSPAPSQVSRERMLFHSLSPKPSVVLHGPCISQESLISEDLLDSFYPRRTQSFLG